MRAQICAYQTLKASPDSPPLSRPGPQRKSACRAVHVVSGCKPALDADVSMEVTACRSIVAASGAN